MRLFRYCQPGSRNPLAAARGITVLALLAIVHPDAAIGQGLERPRSEGVVQVDAVIPADAAGWSKSRPRAVAEPRLEAWAARRLGDPAAIVVADVEGTRHTLAEAELAALDVVFAADAATLERELRAAIPALGGAPLAAERSTAWPKGAQPILQVAVLARTLRTLIVRATSISPAKWFRGSPA